MPDTPKQVEAKVPPDAATAIEILEGVAQSPTLVKINQAARLLPTLQEMLGRVSIRISCLSSFTFEPLKNALELQGAAAGFAISAHVAPFGRFEQELIDPNSQTAMFEPHVVLLTVRLRDGMPSLYEEFNGLTASDSTAMLEEWFSRLESSLRSFRTRTRAHVLIQNYEVPVNPSMGLAEDSGGHSQTALIQAANARLRTLARSIENTHVMDYDALIARVGREVWCDDRMRLFARIPVASAHYWRLAGFYVRHLRPLYGLAKKVLVLDADHTLWGGVVGDVGVHGIQLGHDFPGNAFVEFQKKILDLHRRGVVLAIASKNEPAIVEQVLSEHSDMVLKREHFSAMRVNWKPKPDNLREIAAELNLGIDSFVFIDDSPVECELMRKTLPEVLTIQLPKDPAGYPRVADHLDCFDQWTVSEEDRRRGALYRAESERKQLQANVIDMPTFYRQLEMRMTVYINDESHVARASQMTNRTNQFNMHTQRCSEDDIRRFMNDGEHELVTVALADRFGDNGVIGMTLIHREAECWRLPQFLMSCRVLGRTIEHTLLRWIAHRAKVVGAQRITAEFVPTAKNKPFAGFYGECGLRQTAMSGDIQLWELGLDDEIEPLPEWIELIVQGGN